MKWKYYPISAQDKRATAQVSENFRVDRTLVKKLQAQFPLGTGEMLAVALEDLDLDSLTDFSYATYRSGKRWDEAAGTTSIPIGDRVEDGLIDFLAEYLRSSDEGVVAMQDWASKRSEPYWDDPARLPYCLPTRRAFFNDEVFNLLTPQDTDPRLMEETIRDASQFWFVGICAEHVTLPQSASFSEVFIDELVQKTKHIFVPAFDNEGYLVWTPIGKKLGSSR